MSDSIAAKAALRATMRARMRAVTEDECATLISVAQKYATEHWSTSMTVAIYGGLRGEPDLVTHFLPWLTLNGHRAALFAVADEKLTPRLIRDAADYERGILGAWEPAAHCPELAVGALDVIWVPGLAFSPKTGARLGRGGGYYDRLLADQGCRARKITLAHAFQLQEDVPAEAHDQRVELILTADACITPHAPA